MNKHFNESQIQAYLDSALDAAGQARLETHLHGCPECQRAFEAAHQRSEQVQERLSLLQTQSAAPTLEQARAAFSVYRERKENTMWKKLLSPAQRPALVTVVVILLLAASLAIPSVRAAAVDFLGLFRVQKIQFVQIDLGSKMGDLDSAFQTFGGFLEEQVKFAEKGKTVESTSLEEIRQLASFPIRMPTYPPGDSWEYSFHPGIQAEFTVDASLLQPILSELGDDLQLPQALNGADVKVDVDGGFTARTGDCNRYLEQNQRPRDCITFTQVRSPEVTGPMDADLQELGRIYLRILGFSEQEARSFSQNVDWATTLVVPIPVNDALYTEVDVDGVKGALLRTKTSGNIDLNPYFTLVWIKDGILYGISGRSSTSQALEMANSLK